MSEHERGVATLVCMSCGTEVENIPGGLTWWEYDEDRGFYPDNSPSACSVCGVEEDFRWLEFTRESDGTKVD